MANLPDDPVAMLKLALSIGSMDPRFRQTCEDVIKHCHAQAGRIHELEGFLWMVAGDLNRHRASIEGFLAPQSGMAT